MLVEDQFFHKSGGRSDVHTFSKSSGGENFGCGCGGSKNAIQK